MKDLKIFTENVEDAAMEVINNIADNPLFDGKPIRIMPDVHASGNIVVGFTCPMSSHLNPEHVGEDIGCGIELILFDRVLDREQFPLLEQRIRNVIPMGKELNRNRMFDMKEFCKFIRKEMNKAVQSSEGLVHDIPFGRENDISDWCRGLNIDEKMFYKSIGTLGGGNHFIEVDWNDERGIMGATVHTGSRNLGQKVCRKWAYKAIATGGYLSGNLMQGYISDMVICQAYAKFSRKVILERIAEIYRKMCKGKVTDTISSIHNYLDFEDMTIRKGAIRSYIGEKMVIPFNMRDGLAICEGKSNVDWNNSAPHGSGRRMSRNMARRTFLVDDFEKSMSGIYSTSVCETTIDESPMAYKETEEIIQLIEPTCNIEFFMKPVINIKDSHGIQ